MTIRTTQPPTSNPGPEPRNYQDRGALFIDLLTQGHSPAAAARHLGVPVPAVRRWILKLAQLASELKTTPETRPRDLSHGPIMTGVTLVHSSDTLEAKPGQNVTFTAWVLNDTSTTLTTVELIPRSFTNAGLEPLDYTTAPTGPELQLGPLAPGETAARTFTYHVTENDADHRGEILSAMGVRATTTNSRILWDECDAQILLRRTPAP